MRSTRTPRTSRAGGGCSCWALGPGSPCECGRGSRTRRDALRGARLLSGRWAVAWSGGKDCALALDRALSEGLRVTHLLSLYEGATGRVRFHGVPRELIAAQAEALGLDIVQPRTTPADFEAVFVAALGRLRALGVDGIVFGNIHLADVRAWYEERTTAAGLRHHEPLWGEDPASLVDELVGRGWRPVITGVNLELGRREWLGRTLDRALAQEIASLEGVDPAGERGEYHTFVVDGPRFARPVPVRRTGRVLEREGHALLDLGLAPG